MMGATAILDRAKVLIVEDEPAIVELISYTLIESGMAPTSASSAGEAWEMLRHGMVPHLIVLDWMLPDRSGLEFLGRIRCHHELQDMPVIMLTAKGTEEDKVAGLDGGADDYMTKPFSPRELGARAQALLRRKSPEHAQRVLRAGPVTLDPMTCSVHVNENRITIGHSEYKLLKFLLANPDRVFSRNEILDRVWGSDIMLDERTIDVHILRLRKAVNDPNLVIKTVRGMGYMLATR